MTVHSDLPIAFDRYTEPDDIARIDNMFAELSDEQLDEWLQSRAGVHIKTKDSLLDGLKVLNGLRKDTISPVSYAAEHDIIYCHTLESLRPLTALNIAQMRKLGFHLDNDCEGYAYFT